NESGDRSERLLVAGHALIHLPFLVSFRWG
ncbi:MAG: hypothetical protein ACJA13_003539, partial [Paraglaciecola sp.]